MSGTRFCRGQGTSGLAPLPTIACGHPLGTQFQCIHRGPGGDTPAPGFATKGGPSERKLQSCISQPPIKPLFLNCPSEDLL